MSQYDIQGLRKAFFRSKTPAAKKKFRRGRFVEEEKMSFSSLR